MRRIKNTLLIILFRKKMIILGVQKLAVTTFFVTNQVRSISNAINANLSFAAIGNQIGTKISAVNKAGKTKTLTI